MWPAALLLCLITRSVRAHWFLVQSLPPHLINYPGLEEEGLPHCCGDPPCSVLTTESWALSALMIWGQIGAINASLNYRTPNRAC